MAPINISGRAPIAKTMPGSANNFTPNAMGSNRLNVIGTKPKVNLASNSVKRNGELKRDESQHRYDKPTKTPSQLSVIGQVESNRNRNNAGKDSSLRKSVSKNDKLLTISTRTLLNANDKKPLRASKI